MSDTILVPLLRGYFIYVYAKIASIKLMSNHSPHHSGQPTMREFSPYEKTHLARFHYPLSQAQQQGEKPVEYITGHVIFNQLDLLVNPDTLIPRVETEALAKIGWQLIYQRITQAHQNQVSILDMGTGCGAVGLFLAQQIKEYLPNIRGQIDLTDISPAALQVAAANCQLVLGIQANVTSSDFSHISLPFHFQTKQLHLDCYVSDILNHVSPDKKFDLMVANLPYIPSARIPALDASVKNYEPWLALDGGPEGLDLIGRLLDQAVNFLSPEGQILLEVDYTHDDTAFQPWFDRYEFTFQLDEFLRQRYVITRRRPVR